MNRTRSGPFIQPCRFIRQPPSFFRQKQTKTSYKREIYGNTSTATETFNVRAEQRADGTTSPNLRPFFPQTSGLQLPHVLPSTCLPRAARPPPHSVTNTLKAPCCRWCNVVKRKNTHDDSTGSHFKKSLCEQSDNGCCVHKQRAAGNTVLVLVKYHPTWLRASGCPELPGLMGDGWWLLCCQPGAPYSALLAAASWL